MQALNQFQLPWQRIGPRMLLHQVIKGSLGSHAVLAHQPGQANQGRALHRRHAVNEDWAVLLQFSQVPQCCFQFIRGGQTSGAMVR